MPLPFIFANVTSAHGSDLDNDFAALGALTPIPCTVAGSNALVLTPATDTPTIGAYENYQPFSGAAISANTSGVTISVGGLSALVVYEDTPAGPVALTGGEIQPGNFIYAVYDSALNSGAGGFHLLTAPATPGARLGATSSITSNTGVTMTQGQLTGGGTGQGIIQRAGSPSGDFNDQAPAASALVSVLPGAVVGTTFRFRVVNTSGHTQTVTTNTNITLIGGVTTANAASHDYIGLVTAIGTPAVTIFG